MSRRKRPETRLETYRETFREEALAFLARVEAVEKRIARLERLSDGAFSAAMIGGWESFRGALERLRTEENGGSEAGL